MTFSHSNIPTPQGNSNDNITVGYRMEFDTPLRVVFIRNDSAPTREELKTEVRTSGDILLQPFNAEWAGYIVETDALALAAQWIVHSKHLVDITLLSDEVNTGDSLYTMAVYLVDDESPEEIKLI